MSVRKQGSLDMDIFTGCDEREGTVGFETARWDSFS